MVSEKQKQFIRSEIMTLTLSATLQRNKTYKKEVNDEKRAEFRKSVRNKLITLSDEYKSGEVSPSAHIKNISKLSNEISEEHKDKLDSGMFRIGAAQKALNMYLKYLWCLDEIKEPPHCPIDAIILKEAKIYGVAWTKIDSKEEYKELIEKVRNVAKNEGLSLAEWELKVWERQR